MLSFSTCWNNGRHTDGEAMIDEILDLGFRNIELSHGMTIAKLPGIRKAYQAGKFTCSGVHNYFPSPVEVMIDAPDAYEYTSHRSFDRSRALDMTLQTLEIAAEFRANYLVLHMGSVPLKPAKYTKRLTAMVADGKILDPDYNEAKINFIKKREKIAPLYYGRAIDALEQLVVKAEEYGIILRCRVEPVLQHESCDALFGQSIGCSPALVLQREHGESAASSNDYRSAVGLTLAREDRS